MNLVARSTKSGETEIMEDLTSSIPAHEIEKLQKTRLRPHFFCQIEDEHVFGLAPSRPSRQRNVHIFQLYFAVGALRKLMEYFRRPFEN